VRDDPNQGRLDILKLLGGMKRADNKDATRDFQARVTTGNAVKNR
jgi:hypothetical protein